jgi:hypothetical protein
VAQELFGDDLSQNIVDVLAREDEREAAGEVEPSPEYEALPPAVQEAVDYVRNEKGRTAYETELARVKEDLPEDIELHEDLFHPFVAAAEGDWKAAEEAYKTWYGQAKEKFGLNVPNPEDVPEPAPTTIDGKSASPSSATPTEKEYTSFDDALDDFFKEQKRPPSTVGSV